MTILLDENFPLGLLRRLQNDGLIAEHIITLGWRGASDSKIRERLQDEQLLFLTQDEDERLFELTDEGRLLPGQDAARDRDAI